MPVVRTKINRRVEHVRPQKIVRQMGLREFYDKRNRVLIVRAVGGLGDIFMHRMIFEDFKRLMPDMELHFACPRYYHDAVSDHPFIDKLVAVEDYDRNDYLISYNTTTACGRTEMRLAPFCDIHRSDIWANHCGVTLTKHDMHIRLSEDEKKEGRRLIEEARDRPGPSVAVCPISAMVNKNLNDGQLLSLIAGLRDRNCFAFALHNMPIYTCLKNDIPMVQESKIRRWMAVLDQVDYVISVDTAAFHCAGGMGKPLIGIYTFADGVVYGKYFDFVLVQKHRQNDPLWTCGPCYNWGTCPKTSNNPKPCLTEITTEMLLNAVDNMLAKWPKRDST